MAGSELAECYTVNPLNGQLSEVAFQTPHTGFGWPPGSPENRLSCEGSDTNRARAIQRYSHDVAGRVKFADYEWFAAGSATPAGRHHTCYDWDVLGRLSSRASQVIGGDGCTLAGSLQKTEYGPYDDLDQLLGMDVHVDGALTASHAFAYEGLGRPFIHTQSVPPETVGHAANQVMVWSYLRDGRVSTVTRSADLLVSAGPPPTFSDPFIFKTTHAYDSRGRIELVTDTPLTATAISSTRTYEYQHDGLDRLTYARCRENLPFMPPYQWNTVYERTYAFDATQDWNIATMGPAPQVTRTYDEHDRVESVNGSTTAAPVYDFGGNVTCDGSREMAWDQFNRLSTVSHQGLVTTYSYDPFNRLIARQSNDGSPLVSHFWDGWEKLGEHSASAAGGHEELTTGPQGPLGRWTSAEGQVHLRSDWQGNAKLHADLPTYDPYGSLVGGASGDYRSFQGHEWRPEAGLYYMRNRWMDPATATFLSRDPIVSEIGATYAFVGSSPLLHADPLGLYRLHVSPAAAASRMPKRPGDAPGFTRHIEREVRAAMKDVYRMHHGCADSLGNCYSPLDFFPAIPGKERVDIDVHVLSAAEFAARCSTSQSACGCTPLPDGMGPADDVSPWAREIFLPVGLFWNEDPARGLISTSIAHELVHPLDPSASEADVNRDVLACDPWAPGCVVTW